jgi:hypothetical protein
MAIHSEMQRIGASFAQHGIPAAPLKGTQLALRLYGHLGARRCSDIDILVPAEHSERAHAMLLDAGYRSHQISNPGVKDHPFHGVPLVRSNGAVRFVVELHWGISDARFVPADCVALWQRILASDASATGLHQLPSEEELLFLAIHLPKHDIGLLRLLADVHHLVVNEQQSIDWDYLIALAEHWCADDMLYFALSFAGAVLGTPAPGDVLARLKPSRVKNRVVRRLTGPDRILHPPRTAHLRISRFRIAYCLMMKPPRRALRAYRHYVLLPPVDPGRAVGRRTVSTILRPLSGATRTVLAFQASLLDR